MVYPMILIQRQYIPFISFLCQATLGNIWGYFLLSQLADCPDIYQSIEARDAGKQTKMFKTAHSQQRITWSKNVNSVEVENIELYCVISKKSRPILLLTFQFNSLLYHVFTKKARQLYTVTIFLNLFNQCKFSSVQFNHSVMSDFLWCHPTISSSVFPFSSCLQSYPASGSFPMSPFFTSGGQSIGVSVSTSVLPMNIQDWFPLGWTGWISSQFKGLSRVLSSATV